MNFSSSQKVLSTIRMGDSVERVRGENRSKVQDAANNFPLLTPDEAKKIGLKVNVRWGELMTLLAQGMRQYRTAFRFDQQFFKVNIPQAPYEHQTEWQDFISEAIAMPMRRSPEYFWLQEQVFASVVTHGPGPSFWWKKDPWCPKFVPVADLRIPTDATVDWSSGGDWWAVRERWSPMDLLDEVVGDARWDRKAVKDILKSYKEINITDATTNLNWETDIEKLHSLMKQNGGFYSSDAVPSIPLWHFFFKDTTDEANAGIWMVVVPEDSVVRGEPSGDFLWQDTKPISQKREHLLHIQMGDLNTSTPAKYHEMRSLGFALLEPCFYTDLTRCKFVQHVLDNFNIWLRSADPGDRSRAMIQQFSNLGVLRPGISVIPSTERHQVDSNNVELVLSNLKQLQQEASASYTQSSDTGTRKEQTAFETSVKVQQVNSMTSGMLTKSFIIENWKYREIARRFCRQNSTDPDVKEFQKNCAEAGIPKVWLDVRKWDIEPVTPLGMGNPTMAMAMAEQLLKIMPMLDPTAQQEIKHEIVSIYTQDPRKAARWAPIKGKRKVSEGQRDSQSIFGTLMQGIPLPAAEGMSVIDQIEGMLPLLAGKIAMLEQRDNMAKPEEAQGLMTVDQYTQSLITRLSQNESEKQRAREYADALGQLRNQIKGLAQRGAEAAQQQAQQAGGPQQDPTAMAKVQTTMMTAAAKIKAKEMADQQKMRQAEGKFTAEQRRQDAKTYHDMERERLQTHAEMANAAAVAAAQPKSESD